MMPRLSIIIPAYNEDKKIGATLKKVEAYISTKDLQWEIILVDDGSMDRTVEVAEKTIKDQRLKIIRNGINKGKGYSVKTGVLASKGDVVLVSDADLSAPIEELDRMLPWFKEGCDIVIGSRAMPDSVIEPRQPRHRETMGKIFNLLVRAFVLKGFKDTQCGFKCFKRDAAMKIFSLMKTNGFAFDVEVLLLAKKFGFKIKEIPVRWKNSPESKVRIIKDSLSMLAELIKIKIHTRSIPNQ